MPGTTLRRTLQTLSLCLLPALACAHGGDHDQVRAADVRASAFGVRGELGAAAAGVADLKFRDFFRLPIGPAGLEPTERLLALDGKRVRLVGYMVEREESVPGTLILAPLPLATAESEDGAADDLPAAVAYVHLDGAAPRSLPYLPGLLRLTGTLQVGVREEADGRASTVRLQLDARSSRALLRLAGKAVASKR